MVVPAASSRGLKRGQSFGNVSGSAGKETKLTARVLPHRDKDAILRLYSHSFNASELMYEMFGKLHKKAQIKNLSGKDTLIGVPCYITG
jgi:hypothetical protein